MAIKIFMGLLSDPNKVKHDRCLLVYEPEKVLKGRAGFQYGVFTIDNIHDYIIYESSSSKEVFSRDMKSKLENIFCLFNSYDCDSQSQKANILTDCSCMDLKENLTYLFVYNPDFYNGDGSPQFDFLTLSSKDTNFSSLEEYLNSEVRLNSCVDETSFPKEKMLTTLTPNVYGLPELILDDPSYVKSLIPQNILPAVYPTLSKAEELSWSMMQKETQVREILYYCTHDMANVGHPYRIFGLHGAPGTVKSELVKCIASHLGYPLVTVVLHSKITIANLIQETLPVYDEQTGESRLEVKETPLAILLKLGVPFCLFLDEANNGSDLLLKNFSSSWTSGQITVGQKTIVFNPNIIHVFMAYNPSGKMFQEESMFSRAYLIRREEKTNAEKFLYDCKLNNYIVDEEPYPVLVNNQTLYDFDLPLSFRTSHDSMSLVPSKSKSITTMPKYNIYVNGKVEDVLTTVKEFTVVDLLPVMHEENVSSNTITALQYSKFLGYWEAVCNLIKELHITDVSIRDSYIDGGLCHFTNRHRAKFMSDIYLYHSVAAATWYYVYNNIQDYVIRVKNFVPVAGVSLAVQLADHIINTLQSDIDSLEKILFVKKLNKKDFIDMRDALSMSYGDVENFKPKREDDDLSDLFDDMEEKPKRQTKSSAESKPKAPKVKGIAINKNTNSSSQNLSSYMRLKSSGGSNNAN